jgi:GTP-binding protein
MKFVDEAEIEVSGGHGGSGCLSFLREKYRPKGGPDGGNGGDGGNVVLVVDPGLSTLLDFKFQRRLEAENGEPGRGKNQHGRRGRDCVVRVPPGTIVRCLETGEILADLRAPGAKAIVGHGGRGGRGNATYASPTNQAPRRVQPGTPGEHRRVRLELRLMADVGLVGFPNVGKSTLIRRVSAARPRVADYPFTTLVPHLGVVRFAEDGHFVLADIPGVIEGAHTGQGLGFRFLRHVSRTALLVHLLDASGLSERDPLADFDAINRELALFDPELAKKPQVVVANKIDLVTSPEALENLTRRFRKRRIRLHRISAATGAGVAALMREVGRRVRTARQHEAGSSAEAVVEHG